MQSSAMKVRLVPECRFLNLYQQNTVVLERVEMVSISSQAYITVGAQCEKGNLFNTEKTGCGGFEIFDRVEQGRVSGEGDGGFEEGGGGGEVLPGGGGGYQGWGGGG